MGKARCGNPDLGTYNTIGRPVNVDLADDGRQVRGRSGNVQLSDNYVTQTVIWPKKHLRWFIEDYPKKQTQLDSNDQIRRIIGQAFQDWQNYSGLTFEMAKSKETADFKIRFRQEDHGDGYPFDGPGTTLAHAFYPKSGDIHFDDDEHFTDKYKNDYQEYTLRLVAAHEIGHALGLSHSFEPESLMYPVYQQFNASYTLSNDDQQGIQALYGKPAVSTPSTTPLKTTRSPSIVSSSLSSVLPVDNWCADDFQTACEGPDNELYMFNDNRVWRYQARHKRSWDVQPQLIHERFPALSDTTITACVRSSMGYTYLFRNYRMWRLKTHWSSDGPHILHGKNYPQNPRLALLHQNSIYLIRNRLIYRLNEFDYDQELEIATIDTILNPPPNEFIHSGFTYAKRHYIFTKDLVYVYDATHGNLLPDYPRSRTNGWFACESVSQAPRWKKKLTTIRPMPTRSFREHERNEYEDDTNFHPHHHHHRHHHHQRPRRPFHHRGISPSPPQDYRRRWQA
jgi:predicted Zn-dependent protease